MVAVGVQSIEKPAKMKTNKQQSLFFFLFIFWKPWRQKRHEAVDERWRLW
jgi:hypothetical protein